MWYNKINMTNKGYKQITAVIFLIISIVHGLRLLLGWPVTIGSISIPIWISAIAVVMALTLACYGFKLGQEEKRKKK